MNTITNENNQYPLMPINQTFLDVFDTFMNTEQRNKIRANNVRQYTEGIIDLLLKDKITAHLKPTELYEGLSWKKNMIQISLETFEKYSRLEEKAHILKAQLITKV